MTLLALIFRSSMCVIRIVKKITKLVVPFLYSSITLISTLIFAFPSITFQNKSLSRIANRIVTDINLPKLVQKATDIVGNISLLSFFNSLTEDNLTEFS